MIDLINDVTNETCFVYICRYICERQEKKIDLSSSYRLLMATVYNKILFLSEKKNKMNHFISIFVTCISLV